VSAPGAAGLRRRVEELLTPSRAAFAGIFVVTWLAMLTIGTTLPVLPKYVKGPIGAGDLEVGIVTGAFAVTGLLMRPIAGSWADANGRKRVVVLGSLFVTLSGALLFVPGGLTSLLASRLSLGAGEGMVYTAGAAWVVDITPPHRRGRILGLYGLAIWGGLSLGPPIGELTLHLGGYDAVWAFVTVLPALAAVAAMRLPERYQAPARRIASGLTARVAQLIARESVGPGLALALCVVGYATLAAFIVLHLDARGIGHGAFVFTVFAFAVVATRIVGGGLPDRLGGSRMASIAAVAQALGMFTLSVAESLPVALVGALVMGFGFGSLFPSLALLVVNSVPIERRGAAMGTFTAFFDIGVGLGAPLAGVAVAVGGYGLAFAVGGVFGLLSAALSVGLGRRRLRAAAG
jgi:MFS family permease